MRVPAELAPMTFQIPFAPLPSANLSSLRYEAESYALGGPWGGTKTRFRAILLIMRWISLLALAPFAGYLFLADVSVEKHVEALQKSKSLKVTFVVNHIGGASEEDVLTFSKPNRFKWETPAMLVVSDGKTVFSYDKVKKVYTKKDAGDGTPIDSLGADAVWAWSAFFNEKFGEAIASSEKGNAHKVRDIAVTDILVTRKDKRVFTFQVDDALGVARGVRYTMTENGQPSETIVLAKELEMGADEVGAEAFAWAPPADAKDATQAAADGLHFAAIKPILDKNCAGCHTGPAAKDGIDLSSYQSVMASRTVRAGNPESSRLMRVLRSGKMPPAGPLPQGDLNQLAKWITDGALE